VNWSTVDRFVRCHWASDRKRYDFGGGSFVRFGRRKSRDDRSAANVRAGREVFPIGRVLLFCFHVSTNESSRFTSTALRRRTRLGCRTQDRIAIRSTPSAVYSISSRTSSYSSVRLCVCVGRFLTFCLNKCDPVGFSWKKNIRSVLRRTTSCLR
jgi:hypothetical protein